MDLGEGVSGPEAKKSQKSLEESLEKSLPGPGPKSPKKVSKKVRKVFEDPFSDFFGLFGPFSRLFSDFWAPASGDFFRDFFETQIVGIHGLPAATGSPLFIRKILLVSVKTFVRNSGAGNGCANFMGVWKMRPFCRKKTHFSHKIPHFRGGVFWVLGGGSADLIFMGTRAMTTNLRWAKSPIANR